VFNYTIPTNMVNQQNVATIMCIFEQTIGDVLTQTFILRKDLTKCNKRNGIMHMELHMECMHLKLFT
jgi:hypothetical protein